MRRLRALFTSPPGQAYEEADNGNRSAVHWDMVMIQTPEHGGGEMFFDGNLIRKDGQFVHPAFGSIEPGELEMSRRQHLVHGDPRRFEVVADFIASQYGKGDPQHR